MIIATQVLTLTDELEALSAEAVDGCHNCGSGPERQHELRRVQDGALLRLDLECEACGIDHPTWFDRVAA